MARPPEIDPRSEFAEAKRGDRRLNTRLDRIVASLEDAPDRSFPNATDSDAELEGAYRFFQNHRVTLAGLVAPHLEATVRRAEQVGKVFVVHDTTEFRFDGRKRREGLGRINNKGQGFFGHFALVLSAADRAPLGLAGVLPFVRDHVSPNHTERVDYNERRNKPRESARWLELIKEAEDRLWHLGPIHVMDREADDFELFAAMAWNKARFVARMAPQRRRKGTSSEAIVESRYIEDLVRAAPVIATREVKLSPRAGKRGPQSERTYPVRDGRLATLAIAGLPVTIDPPRGLVDAYEPLRLSMVRVFEPEPPPNEPPIEWILITSESVASSEQMLAVVDAYRARWTIEEYFKALKTGCAYESRQLESYDALLAALGVFAPLAVRMLALRSLARSNPTAPANTVLSEHELLALRAIGRTTLPPSPTARDALWAIAALGGHLKRNGDPGWLVIARGLEKLDIAARVVEAISDGRSKK